MKAREMMTQNPTCCTPETSAFEAAKLMADHDCGCIPVVEDERSNRLIGVVTDRDLAVRGIGQHKEPSTPVRELMSGEVHTCRPDADAEEVERIMSERRVRRVPVVDDSGRCTGMIAQADLARETSRDRLGEDELAHVVESISEPGWSDAQRAARASGAADEGFTEPWSDREALGSANVRTADERQDSIRQGIGVPEESPIGKIAEAERERRAGRGPRIGGAMGGTSDAETPGDEAAMDRSIREADKRR